MRWLNKEIEDHGAFSKNLLGQSLRKLALANGAENSHASPVAIPFLLVIYLENCNC
jgi:hypothetical protein